jgi:hypothetical protein
MEAVRVIEASVCRFEASSGIRKADLWNLSEDSPPELTRAEAVTILSLTRPCKKAFVCIYCWEWTSHETGLQSNIHTGKWTIDRAQERNKRIAMITRYKYLLYPCIKFQHTTSSCTDSKPVALTLCCSRTPTCNFSSTLYPQSCWCIIQVIHSL